MALDDNQEITLLVDGEEAFARIIDRIRGAQHTIVINMFIWRDDTIGNRMAQELIKAADRGVKVHIVKDKLGEVFERAEENKQSFFHKKFILGLWLKAAVIDRVYPMKGKAPSARQRSNPLADALVRHINIRVDREVIRGDHSKYYIFDDKILIMGGMNVEDKTVYTDVEGKHYNDYMIEMPGDTYVEKFGHRLTLGTPFDEQASVEFIINAKRDDKMDYEAKGRILELLSSARESIDIIMAYMGDKNITDKIIECANRGVAINLLLPGKANIQHDANMKVLKHILVKTNNTVNAFLSKNMVHAKLIRVDDQLVTLGSTNLNNQAMKKLMELNVLIKHYDSDFSEVLEHSIRKNLSDAVQVQDASQVTFNPVKAVLEQMV